ncbi:MAG: alcohol dehydrogenase catalytic domain-containing protein [Acidimicrobiales bacterium]
MRAATIVDGQITIAEHPDPEPGTGELLIRVKAAGLNGADLLQRRGMYPPPPGYPADIPGLEIAGEVIGAGPGVTRFKEGDRVMAVVGGAGQAELAVVHERAVMPVPERMLWDEAGGFPEVFVTAHDALFTQAELAMGDRVCIHGAAGGVGTAAIQIAATAGALVTATARASDLHDHLRDLGAHDVLVPDDFPGSGPFDVILELIGAVNLAANLEALALGGRIATIGVGAGATAEINLLVLMQKRARIHGSTLRTRPLEQKAAAARLVEQQVLPGVESGRIKVPVHRTFPLKDAAGAYDLFAAGGKLGKIVLTMD